MPTAFQRQAWWNLKSDQVWRRSRDPFDSHGITKDWPNNVIDRGGDNTNAIFQDRSIELNEGRAEAGSFKGFGMEEQTECKLTFVN